MALWVRGNVTSICHRWKTWSSPSTLCCSQVSSHSDPATCKEGNRWNRNMNGDQDRSSLESRWTDRPDNIEQCSAVRYIKVWCEVIRHSLAKCVEVLWMILCHVELCHAPYLWLRVLLILRSSVDQNPNWGPKPEVSVGLVRLGRGEKEGAVRWVMRRDGG